MIKTGLFLVCSMMLISNAFAGKSSLTNRQEIPKDLKITLERTLCFGTCPVYLLTISSDGTVTFEGRKYTKQQGIVTEKIGQDKLKQLIAEFNKAQYFSLKNQYRGRQDGCPEEWTDAPTVTTSLKINGRKKTIVHYLGCGEDHGKGVYPKPLGELEEKIDEIVGTEQWIK